MARTPRERLLIQLTADDIENYRMIFDDYRNNLNVFTNQRNMNFLHDLVSSVHMQSRILEYLSMIVHRIGNNQFQEFLNASASFDDEKLNPLQLAVWQKKREVAVRLIEYGANPETVTAEKGMNCLHLAAKNNFIYFFLELHEDYKIPLDSVTSNGQNCLHISISNSHFDLAYIIIALIPEINACDSDGSTALHLATVKGKRKIIKHLLLKGADSQIRNSNDEIALDISKDNTRIRSLLKKQKINTNSSYTYFYLLVTVLVIKLLLLFGVFTIEEFHYQESVYYMIPGYLIFPFTIGILLKSSRTPPECVRPIQASLSSLYRANQANQICPYCKCLKLPHTYHCMTCKICVLEYDHHCYWINNCIGKGNLQYFLITLILFTIDFAYSIIISIFLCESIKLYASKIISSALLVFSVILLLVVAPFFYLNISNYLNSTSVHLKFSRQSIRALHESNKEPQINEDPLLGVESIRESADSIFSEFNNK